MCMQEIEVAADVDFEKVAEMCEGYSGDDITNICRDAAMNGMRTLVAGKTPDEIRQDQICFFTSFCHTEYDDYRDEQVSRLQDTAMDGMTVLIPRGTHAKLRHSFLLRVRWIALWTSMQTDSADSEQGRKGCSDSVCESWDAPMRLTVALETPSTSVHPEPCHASY